MKNKIKKIKNSGFTLVETLMVISIFSIIASVTFVMLDGTRDRVVLEDAQVSIVNALERARSRAATGVGTANHGVCIKEDEIIVSEGSACAAVGVNPIALPPDVHTDQTNLDIIFNRLNAIPNIDATIILDYRGETATIEVTPEGIIKK